MTGRRATGGCSADVAARALVAACMLLGVDPNEAFERGRRQSGAQKGGYGARVLAAHGVRARLGVAPVVLARIFAIDKTNLAPTQAKRRGITADQLLVISEAIGPVEADARGRFVEPWSGVPTQGCLKPEARSPKPEARSPGVRVVTPSVKPEVARYASWFLEADWPLGTVARLFDVRAQDLLDALDPPGATT